MSQDIAQEALDYVESRFPVGEPKETRLSVTGEPYVVLVVGGIKPEGDDYTLVATDPGAALEFFKQAFDEYSKDKTGTLYWRRKPTVFLVEDGWQISARLLISAAPQVDFSTTKDATC